MPKIINEHAVFKAVLEVLVARGYDGATTLELASAAEIHEATLFRKFGSKAGLVEKAIEHQLSSAPLSRVAYTGNLEADLLAILEAYVATNEMYGEIVPVLLLELSRHPELRNVLRTPLMNIRGIASILARYQNEGQLIDEPPLDRVNVLIAPVLLRQMIRRADIDLPVSPLDLQGYVHAFLNGRRPRRSAG